MAAATELRTHIRARHDFVTPDQIPKLEEAGRRAPNGFKADECPFCDEWAETLATKHAAVAKLQPEGESSYVVIVTPSRFKRHMAMHQEQLAIFAMPRAVGGDGTPGSGSVVGSRLSSRAADLFEVEDNFEAEDSGPDDWDGVQAAEGLENADRGMTKQQTAAPQDNRHFLSSSEDDGETPRDDIRQEEESFPMPTPLRTRRYSLEERSITRGRMDDEERYIASRIDSRGRMGEAWNGATKDWTIVDVPPGTERVRMGGGGSGATEVTWQRYNGVRRTQFIPERDEMWTEITKDLVCREALMECRYEFEETAEFFYVMKYLKYDNVLELIQITEGIRRERRNKEYWERDHRQRPKYDERVSERVSEREVIYDNTRMRRV
ncbi:hypothetical protein F5X68DRAFT_49344 [Plectosphaerella plurivora]|uniref:DUF8035 domain-containing protein n=1 Tax=Plectosphaerella plurivora TaxID=936078 RepID=A0A9P8VIK4_9PEZI|nr:hypothetical protein F5X68DRAFT_49344 [Plectosphaerella plurivora]